MMMNSAVTSSLDSLLEVFLLDEDSLDFRAPVDWKALGLEEYPVLVKYPMDLGTIKTKMKQTKQALTSSSSSKASSPTGGGGYKHPSEFWRDLHKTWDNCIAFNRKTSPINKLAQRFKKMTDEAETKWFEEHSEFSPRHRPVSPALSTSVPTPVAPQELEVDSAVMGRGHRKRKKDEAQSAAGGEASEDGGASSAPASIVKEEGGGRKVAKTHHSRQKETDSAMTDASPPLRSHPPPPPPPPSSTPQIVLDNADVLQCWKDIPSTSLGLIISYIQQHHPKHLAADSNSVVSVNVSSLFSYPKALKEIQTLSRLLWANERKKEFPKLMHRQRHQYSSGGGGQQQGRRYQQQVPQMGGGGMDSHPGHRVEYPSRRL